MGIIAIKCPGVITTPLYGKATPLPDPLGALYGLYFLGTTYTGADPLLDLTSNGRTLTKTGSNVIGTTFAATDATNYFTAPFSGANLMARTSGVSIVLLEKIAANQNSYAVSNFEAAGTPNIALNLHSADAVRAFGSSASVNQATIAADAARGTTFEAYGLTTSRTDVNAYRKKPGGSLQTATTTFADQAVGGNTAMRVGKGYTADAGAGSIAVVGFYDAKMSTAQMGEVLDALLALRGAYGLA